MYACFLGYTLALQHGTVGPADYDTNMRPVCHEDVSEFYGAPYGRSAHGLSWGLGPGDARAIGPGPQTKTYVRLNMGEPARISHCDLDCG